MDTKILSRSYLGPRICLEGIMVSFSKYVPVKAEVLKLLSRKDSPSLE